MNTHNDKAIIFKLTFGVPLFNFMSPITGFNIIEFDKFVKTPDGISLKQHLINKYSIQASNLVNSLLS